MKRIGLVLLFLFAACGKNDAVSPVGTSQYYPPQGPVNQAPMPPNGGYPPPGGYPSGGYPPGGGGYPPPYFQPMMPPSMPPQFVVFVPIYQYFQRTPQLQNIYVNIWVDWQNYANYYHYNQYDFNGFWFDYCRNNWVGTEFNNLYTYYDQNVYWWTQPGMSYCDGGCDTGTYWSYYSGMDYTPLDNYYCSDCYY